MGANRNRTLRPKTKAGGRVSMHHVATHAGVSRAAVSLALRGDPSIPPPTRERILSAVRELGYRKNPLVAALMTVRRLGRVTGAAAQAPLAFLTSHDPPGSWRRGATLGSFFAAARARARHLGFRLDEFALHGTAMRPERLRAILKERGIHGVLVAPLPGVQTRLDFDVTDFAVVGLGMSVQEPAIDRVADDHYYAARLAFERCLALGYRRVGLALAADISQRLENRWWAGYLVAQQQVPVSARIPALMPETREGIPPQLNGWIGRHRVDAVVFSLREQALMASAPRGVGLVSLSVHDSTGQIAGIMQDEKRVGEDAVDLLIAKLHGWDTGSAVPPRLHLVRGGWRDGRSAPGYGRERQGLIDAQGV